MLNHDVLAKLMLFGRKVLIIAETLKVEPGGGISPNVMPGVELSQMTSGGPLRAGLQITFIK